MPTVKIMVPMEFEQIIPPINIGRHTFDAYHLKPQRDHIEDQWFVYDELLLHENDTVHFVTLSHELDDDGNIIASNLELPSALEDLPEDEFVKFLKRQPDITWE